VKKLFNLPRAFARRKVHPLTWKRRWKVLVLDLLGREESPERVAAAIAMGIGVGFSPFIGFHIWIALGLAFLLRLNKIDAALGQFAGNPWTLPAVYAFGYRLGRWILDYDRRSVPRLAWDRLLHSDFWKAFKGPAFAPRLLSFLVGTTVIAILIGVASYVIFLGILRIYHRRHPRVALRAANRRSTDKLRLLNPETKVASEESASDKQ
jgi:uncharacterized protein (DUF2062 family)